MDITEHQISDVEGRTAFSESKGKGQRDNKMTGSFEPSRPRDNPEEGENRISSSPTTWFMAPLGHTGDQEPARTWMCSCRRDRQKWGCPMTKTDEEVEKLRPCAPLLCLKSWFRIPPFHRIFSYPSGLPGPLRHSRLLECLWKPPLDLHKNFFILGFFWNTQSLVQNGLSLCECKLVQPLWKTAWRFLKMLKIELPYDPAIALLGIYPKDTNVVIQRDTCTRMFIAAMSTIAKLWKEPRCPSTDEWIKKMWYIYTMEYYAAIKRNEILPFATTWMELERIVLSEISQAEKDNYHMISLI
ncbi:uncharacterized protein LOC132022318 [Mustela nigripes]|uniref:uncharacterized protein LOC132022318 n=1 Tax=Mustela nigripes TaxID=77151 RepID=UPI00281662DF|nr:uncharacterized protein LOC132022318 [Mustela nigripes]